MKHDASTQEVVTTLGITFDGLWRQLRAGRIPGARKHALTKQWLIPRKWLNKRLSMEAGK